MADMDPVDDAARPDRFRDRVEAVADDAVDAAHPDLLQGLDDEVGDGLDGHSAAPKSHVEPFETASRSPVCT